MLCPEASCKRGGQSEVQSPCTQQSQQAWAVSCTFYQFPTEKGGGRSHQLGAACPAPAPQGLCSISVTEEISKKSQQQSCNDHQTPPYCNMFEGVSIRAWSKSLNWNGVPILCAECHLFPTAFRSEAKTKDHQLINRRKPSHYLLPSPSYYTNTTLSCCELPKFWFFSIKNEYN